MKTHYPFVKENVEEDMGSLMLQVLRLWEEYHERVLKQYYDLSYIQYTVLESIHRLVSDGDKQVSQISLAKHIKINPMTISQIFRVLEKKGYIYRTTHTTDVRAKSVNLTEAGKEVVSRAVTTVINLDNKFFKVLGKNIQFFNKYLRQLLKTNDLI